MPENMPKPSMLPAPNHFQYASSFIGTYQHLFLCHLLCPTDFQHPSPCPHFKCFQQFSILALANVQVSAAYSATFQTVLFVICFFCSQFNFPVSNFFLSMNNVLPIAVLTPVGLSLVAYSSSDIQLSKYLNWLTYSNC